MRKADKTRHTGKKKYGKRIIAAVLILAADANPQSFGDTTYPIKEVFVKVGDSVKAGDRLYTLDMTDVENDIALAQKKLSIEQQQNAIDQAAAGRAVRSAQETSAQQYEDATRTLTEQAEDTNKAILEQVHSQQDVDRFIRAEADAKAALNAAQKAADAADQKYAELQNAVSNAQIASNDASHAAASAPDVSKLMENMRTPSESMIRIRRNMRMPSRLITIRRIS